MHAGLQRCILVLTLVMAFFPVVSAQVTLPDGFHRTLVADRLDPTAMTQAPDGRLFLTMKHGKVLIVRDDQLLPDPFVTVQVDNNNERGLGGIALHPQFEQTHWVYLFYTVPGANINRLSRFTANGDVAIPGSEEILFETDELRAAIHNGGAMQFGADGKLYLSTGEGSEPRNAESLSSVLGKILRLNDDGTIPEDNPFYDELSGKHRAIWAYGLRNAYSMGYDPVTDRLYANDVGGGDWEEINLIERGAFYGWDRLEGVSNGHNLPANYRDPVYAYDHSEGCAIVGATVYRPETLAFPAQYHGKYFYADYCAGAIRVLDLNTYQPQETFMTGGQRIVAMLTSHDGGLYYLERRGISDGSPQDNTGTDEGMLWKVTYGGSGAPQIAIHPEPRLVPVGEPAAFYVEASGSAPLTYQWYRDGQPVAGALEQSFAIPATSLSDSGSVMQCLVTNAQGQVWSDSALLSVTNNHRPEIQFVSPDPEFIYRAGDTIAFAAVVQDPEEGVLPADQISWWVQFHHNTHTHPVTGEQPGPPQGTFVVPRIGEIDTDVWYRVYVRARDKQGLTHTAFAEVFPQMTSYIVDSEPAGLEMLVDGKVRRTPFEVFSVAGIQRTVVAPVNQVMGDRIYFFDGWQQGVEDPALVFHAPEAAETFVAQYRSRPLGTGTGLSATYFPDVTFSHPDSVHRIDTTIDFNFFFDAPFAGLPEDMFSIRWRGFLLPYETGNHTFTGIVNDGLRMWIDGEQVFELWEPTATARLVGGTTWLEGGRLYPVTIEYYEYTWGANVQLWWSGDTFEQEIVPRSQLFPADYVGTRDELAVAINPNPVAAQRLDVTVTTLIADEMTYRIFQPGGQRVLEGAQQLVIGNNQLRILIGGLPPGIYLFEASFNARDVRVVRRFVVGL